MERAQIWAGMAKIMGDIAGECVEWGEEWLPDRQVEEEGPPGAWKATFTIHLPEDVTIVGHIIVSPALIERANLASAREGDRSLFQQVALQLGDAILLHTHKNTRMDDMRAELEQLKPGEPIP